MEVVGGGLSPGHDLPGTGLPGHDLPGGGHPWLPGHIPSPPPGVWPPPSSLLPIVPAPPGTPPGAIWPSPGHPSQGLPGGPGHPSQGLPTPPSGTLPARPPAAPDNTLPGGQGGVVTPPIASKVYWMLAYCPSLGWNFVAVDPSLSAGTPLPPAAAPK
jgi:hypothetical protein